MLSLERFAGLQKDSMTSDRACTPNPSIGALQRETKLNFTKGKFSFSFVHEQGHGSQYLAMVKGYDAWHEALSIVPGSIVQRRGLLQLVIGLLTG